MLGIAFALIALTAGLAHALDEYLCLQSVAPSATKVLSGTFDTRQGGAIATDGAIDARSARFELFPYNYESDHAKRNLYPIVTTGSNGCFAGGQVIGDYGNNRYHPALDFGFDLPWDFFYDSAAKPENWNSAGFVFGDDTVPRGTVDGISIWNTWDGIRAQKKDDWLIQGALLTHIHDDCVENDKLRSGTILDSLFDGCTSGVSVRPGSSDAESDGRGEIVTIKSSLLRLEPMAGPPERYAPFGHGNFLKVHEYEDPAISRSPKFVIEDTIFMAEMPSHNPERMGFKPDFIESCRNNVVVWLGEGAFPGILPSCFSLSRDRSVWDAAVADWQRRHPSVAGVAPQPTSAPTVRPTATATPTLRPPTPTPTATPTMRLPSPTPTATPTFRAPAPTPTPERKRKFSRPAGPRKRLF